MDYKDLISEFSVQIYSEPEEYSQVLSKARCRIFYKRFNRNGTYITDDFAEKLISTIPYTPVKGIYDTYDGDYTDHGAKRDLGRIYGIVPQDPNFAWENHVDEDGVERTYACVDVLLFTALYKEASDIISKSQSMELYAPSIKGDFQYIEGKKAYVYEDACFLGLQILGESVEPCFEGASFYTLYDSIKELMAKIEVGGKPMERENFKLSDSQKYNMIFSLLNPDFNEAGEYKLDYALCDIYDGYAIAFAVNSGNYERVYYTKNDENDSLTLDKKEVCFIVDVNEAEKDALNRLFGQNGNTFEKIDENFILKEDSDKLLVEKDNSIATLTTERDTYSAQVEALQSEKDSLTEQVESLSAYKKNIEDAEKQTVFDKYADVLDEEIIEKYSSNKDEYTIETLEKELAYELVKANDTIFSKNPQPTIIPKPEPVRSGLEQFLEKYKK